jgi:hypothetical protein
MACIETHAPRIANRLSLALGAGAEGPPPPAYHALSILVAINWGVFWTPEFLIGVVVIGLLLNVVAAYVVRSLDWFARVLPASFRRAQEAESARLQQLTNAATADHAIYPPSSPRRPAFVPFNMHSSSFHSLAFQRWCCYWASCSQAS